MVVDVRRARERILYEDYLKMLGSGSSVSQQLLFPERLVLSDSEYALLEENAVEFASLGFDLDFQGDCAVEVKGTPADMPADSVDQLLYELLQAFSTPVSLADVRREKIAAVMARGAAKQTARLMSRDEAAALLARLAASGNFSFFAIGQSHNRRDNRRRYPGQVGIIRRKTYICINFRRPDPAGSMRLVSGRKIENRSPHDRVCECRPGRVCSPERRDGGENRNKTEKDNL